MTWLADLKTAWHFLRLMRRMRKGDVLPYKQFVLAELEWARSIQPDRSAG